MSLKDKVSKSIWELFEFSKETTKKNLVQAVNSKQLKIDEDSLKVLLSVVDSSISEGYNKGLESTTKKISTIFSEDNLKKKK